MKKARVAFLGRGPIAERAFQMLLQYKETGSVDVVAVVTNCSAEASWWGSCRIADEASKRLIPCLDNARKNPLALRRLLESSQADCIVSVQHPHILPAEILDLVQGKAWNYHNAPLPRYKGYNSVSHAILDGQSIYGGTLHWIVPEVDAGDIAFESRFHMHSTDTALEVYVRSVAEARPLFEQFFPLLNQPHAIPRTPQQAEGIFHGPSSLEPYRTVDASCGENVLDRTARALYFPPHPTPVVVDGLEERPLLPQRIPPGDVETLCPWW